MPVIVPTRFGISSIQALLAAGAMDPTLSPVSNIMPDKTRVLFNSAPNRFSPGDFQREKEKGHRDSYGPYQHRSPVAPTDQIETVTKDAIIIPTDLGVTINPL